jgi:hypothetical protein
MTDQEFAVTLLLQLRDQMREDIVGMVSKNSKEELLAYLGKLSLASKAAEGVDAKALMLNTLGGYGLITAILEHEGLSLRKDT